MRMVQQTINIIDVLNERINVLSAEKSRFETDLFKMHAQNASSGLSRILLTIGAIFFGLVSSLSLMMFLGATKADIADGRHVSAGIWFVVSALLTFWSWKGRLRYGTRDTEAVAKLQALIHDLRSKIANLEEEKRDFLLAQERELKNLEKLDVVTEAFAREILDTDGKECPMCAETVKAKARKCRYCGYAFDELLPPA